MHVCSFVESLFLTITVRRMRMRRLVSERAYRWGAAVGYQKRAPILAAFLVRKMGTPRTSSTTCLLLLPFLWAFASATGKVGAGKERGRGSLCLSTLSPRSFSERYGSWGTGY